MTGASAPIADGTRDLGEVAGLAEVLIDGREADVGDMVEGLQTIHHRFANLARLDLVAAGFELALDR